MRSSPLIERRVNQVQRWIDKEATVFLPRDRMQIVVGEGMAVSLKDAGMEDGVDFQMLLWPGSQV